MIYRTQPSGRQGQWSDPLLGGVCSELAMRFGMDVTFVRLAFVLLTLAKGLGILLYGALWLLLPGDSPRGRLKDRVRHNARAVPGQLERSGQRLRLAWHQHRGDQRRAIALALLGTGTAILLWSFGALSWLTAPRLIGIAGIIAGVAILMTLTREGGS